MNRLSGKQVLITGATSGIGKAIAQQFASMGCHLVITGRREERLKTLAADLNAKHKVTVLPFAFDIRDREAIQAFKIGVQDIQFDILINNAGLAKGLDSIQSGSFDDWDAMIDTNVKALIAMTRFFLPQMIERNNGHVINIGSTAGHETYPKGSVYCATKHAVKAITESTKKDVHGTNVRVSMVSPGLVETEFSKVRFDGDQQKAETVYKGMKPLTADDIAEIVVFVANRPEHVNILDSIVMPVAQSSAQMVHRNE